MTRQDSSPQPLPACVTEYIDQVIRRMRYSRRVRQEVRQELLDHFADALADCSDPRERQSAAEEMIAAFGDTKLLAALLRRAKKRNRPAWKIAIIRTAQAFLALLVLFGIYTAWFITGRPTINTNYVAILSERIQPKAPAAENAWPFYRQAIRRFVSPPPTTQPADPVTEASFAWPDMDVDLARMPDYLQAAHRQWMERNEPAWQEYVAASRKPYCWYAYTEMEDVQRDLVHATSTNPRADETRPDDYVWKDSMIGVLLPHLGTIRQLSKMGVWKSRLDSARGDARQAMEDVLAVARVGRHWQNSHTIVIEQLVGAAINNLACEQIGRLAAEKSLTAADLRQAQEDLELLYRDGYPTLGIEGERLMLVDTVQRVFTEGGPGGGHPIPRLGLALLNGAESGRRVFFGDGVYLLAGSLVHVGREQTLAVGNAFYDQLAEWSSLTPYQRKGRPDPEEAVRKLPEFRYWFLRILLPRLGRAADLLYRARCEYQAAITILAMQRYRLDKGQYPASLGTLVEDGYLKQLPADPYAAGPLVYRGTGDAFTLYSVGGDFQDGGGVQNGDDPWGWGQTRAGNQKPGDRVFWPVAALKPYSGENASSQAATLGG